LDLARQYQSLQPEIDAAVLKLLASGQYVVPSGAHPVVTQFEDAAAQTLGVKHAIGVANGTDALLISLRALGIRPGDEVITTTFSFIATAEVVSLLGAMPVFVDIDPDTFNLAPSLIEAAITPRTRAIIPVHLFGHPAPMQEINAIAQRHGLRVLEDAAQAWGARMDLDGVTQSCGALGDMATFSFFPSKNLGACGEGGLITTNDDALAEKVRTLRAHGQRRRYVHDEIGYNSRLHAIQAAILNIKLPHAEAWNDARRANAAHYAQSFAGLPLTVPVERKGARHVYHQYTLRSPQRDKICEALTAAKAGWAIYYPVCLHQQPVYESLGYRVGQFPIAERAAQEVFSLPIFPELRADELEAVAIAVRAGCTR
ncbi:MAG: DegT/DnrJ/EryC1/StrS family aminotransferase, partial [Abitibacteriaceae bacterium]|nr:DegT/DnrJ/EryC1/StrS family aminotransferase [Abditibacteriaceae bacterium]